MHGFRDNEVLYDVIVISISPPGGASGDFS